MTHVLADLPWSEGKQVTVEEQADRRFMQVALRLAGRGLGQTWPNPSVGAVVVRHHADGTPQIVGTGTTADTGRPHAERIALEQAGAAAKDATVYVTLEPCCHFGRTPPCTDALIGAGVRRVVTAMSDPDLRVSGQGHQRLREAGIELTTGMLEDAARALHVGHIHRVQTGRPFVTLKVAVSADEFIAGAGKRPMPISGRAALDQVHLLRAESDAILIGSGTMLADDPQLTVRLPGMSHRSPVRVVLDTHLKIPTDGRLALGRGDAPLWVVTASDDVARQDALKQCGIDVIACPAGKNGRLDLAFVLDELGQRGITRLFVEGGAALSDHLLAERLPGQVILAQSELVKIGPDGVAPTLLAGLRRDGIEGAFRPAYETHWGDDRVTVYRPADSPYLGHRGIL